MNLLSVLLDARAKIADPAHWIQGAFARSAAGYGVNPTDPDACQWCAYGAVLATTGGPTAPGRVDYEADVAMDALEVAAVRLYRLSLDDNDRAVTFVNDRMGHAPILAVFDEAIRSCQESA